MSTTLKLQDFEYHLPRDLIAQYPLPKRDQARLMVVNRRQQTITHDRFCHLEKYLPPGSLMVVNDSKVISARLLGRREKTGGEVEIFLLKRLPDGFSYQTLIRPLRRLKIDEKIIFNGGKIYAQLKNFPQRIVRFNTRHLDRHLSRIGHIPLPPYIKRPDEPIDKQYYQTVFAKNLGSVAAPTAGLHFSKEQWRQLKKKHEFVACTLHINHATFKPVEVEDITQHCMHLEAYCVAARTWRSIKRAKEQERKVVAVGTTACRTLETVAWNQKLKGETDLFIYPGYSFKMVDILLTNFHLPRSTLLILVCAFGGQELMMRAYAQAQRQKYRFYSYGDCMLII